MFQPTNIVKCATCNGVSPQRETCRACKGDGYLCGTCKNTARIHVPQVGDAPASEISCGCLFHEDDVLGSPDSASGASTAAP